MSPTGQIAELFTKLTYTEMTRIADWFAGWTTTDAEGNDIERTISKSQMAENILDWAGEVLAEEEANSSPLEKTD